jgi:hypothetical protein
MLRSKMENRDQPLTKVDAFITKAKSVGAYNSSQATNLTVALNLVREQLDKSSADFDVLKVGEVLESVDKVLDEYGGESKASFQTIATYKGRAKKLLSDFITWNGGDFMQWKTQIAKDANSKAARKSKAKIVPSKHTEPPKAPEVEDSGKTDQTLEIRLSGGRAGRLILPDPLSQKDIDTAWKQIEAYKSLLVTRIDIDAEDDEVTAD